MKEGSYASNSTNGSGFTSIRKTRMEVTMGKEKAQPRGTKQWVWLPDFVFLQTKASSPNPKSKRTVKRI